MIKKYIFTLIVILFQVNGLFAQRDPGAVEVPGAPNVTITNQDITYNEDLDQYELHLACGVDQVDLNGTFTPGRETDEYTVSSIPYDPPFPFTGGAGSTNITADDQWSQAITLPWDFCFFGFDYDKVLLSSNGALTFDVSGETVNANGDMGRYASEGGSTWQFSNQLPYNAQGGAAPFINTIFGVFQDTNPNQSLAGWSINYEVIGAAPYRTLVFNLYKLSQYEQLSSSCATSSGEQTYQMVLYEATNIIDIYVERRAPCMDWQNGVGLIGIQSHPNIQGGLKAYWPPQRNTGSWSANEEAWRFSPSGNLNSTVKWTVDGAEVYSSQTPDGSHTQNVTFTEAETAVKLNVDYQICSSIRGIVSDEFEVVVFMTPSFTVDLGEDIVTCESEVELTPTLHDEDGNLIPDTEYGPFDFLWSPGGETTPSITVTESGEYALVVTTGDADAGEEVCEVTTTINVEIGDELALNDPIAPYSICPDENGEAVFDLNSWKGEIIADPADYDFKFYESETDATADTNEITDPENYAVTTPPGSQEIFVVVANIDGCTGMGSFMLELGEVDFNEVSSYIVCDNEGVGTGSFDLDSQIAAILDGIPGTLNVTFHPSQAEADANTGGITSPYDAADGSIVYVRITDDANCHATFEMTLELGASPDVQDLPLYDICGFDGVAEFDLSSRTTTMLAGLNNATSTFFEDEDDAYDLDSTNEITDSAAFENTVVEAQIIYVRVQENDSPCFTVIKLPLEVLPTPVVNTDISDYAICEVENDEAVFNLTSKEVVANPDDFDISYYLSSDDARTSTDPIADTNDVENYTSSGATIYVRVEDAGNGCYDIATFELVVNPLPVINPIAPLRVCDDGLANGIAPFDLNEATINMVGESNYGVTYYLDEALAEAGDSTPLPADYTNENPYNQTIYARIADNSTGCYILVPVELVVEPAPEANTPEPLVYCDPNNDGEGIFNLRDADDDINTDPNATIDYFRTRADARNNQNPLDDIINNNELDGQASQIIYVRVTIDGLDCYSIVELELIVLPTPVLETPAEVIIGCDINDNGTPIFNLEEIVLEEVVVNLTDLDDYNIYYYANEDNRDNDVQIPVPSAYPSAGGTVIVVVEDIATGCSSEVEIELFVAPLPVVFNPLPLELCDLNNPGDEKELFYLDEATEEITGGDQSLTVTYHESQEDADAGEGALEIPYENSSNNQTIYIRVENEWGCVVTEGITLTLMVNPLPAPVTPEPLEVCDIDNEGFAYFDLDSLKDEIIASEPGVDVTFHETYSDAQTGWEPLVSPYQNIVSGEQVIFARVFFADQPEGTGCFTIIEIILRAVPSPVVPVELDDLYFCAADADTSIRVNLTVYEDIIYEDQDREELSLTYHLTPEAAEAGTGAIADPTNYLLNPPTPVTIYVRLGYTNGVCYNIVPFTLHLIEGPEINDPTALSVCAPIGEPNTATAVFDLLDKREEIIGVQNGLLIRFYELEADALLGNDNYITTPTNYTNTVNPQTIYVRVMDSQENEEDEGCVAFTTLTLRVDPNPEPVTPDPIEICHLDNDAESTIVDLTIRELQILNHESWDLEYYENYRDAVNGSQDAVIETPEEYELPLVDSPKTIYVRVINATSGCFEVVELKVILSQLPEVLPPEDIDPMVVCVTDGSNRARFDLTEKLPEIFGNQNLDGLEVSFYEDLEDAIDGVNSDPDPENFYNRETPQTIYVGVGNPDIDGCYIGGLTWFEIEVREGAFAYSPEESYKVCGMPGPNGDIGSFDLRNPDLIDSILGLQDPELFDVEFFLTEEAAEEGATEDALSSPYENIENPQVIYARVTNPNMVCYAIAEVTLEVIALPGLILEDVYSFCTDEFGNPMEDADGNVIFPIIETGLEAEGYDFTWFFEGTKIVGQVGPSLEADQIGTYTIEIISHDTGCTLTLDIEVVESSLPFTYGAEVTSPAFSGLYNIGAWAEGFGDYWYSLDGGTPQQEGEWSNVGPGSHVVIITDMNGCGSVEVVVNVVDYPKFFTPNDDGYNDTWNIPGMADLDPSAEIHIFDRHGKLLKQINPISEGWDGTFNGKPLPSTDYWFVVKYKEDGVQKEFKGHFSLKR